MTVPAKRVIVWKGCAHGCRYNSAAANTISGGTAYAIAPRHNRRSVRKSTMPAAAMHAYANSAKVRPTVAFPHEA